jgi:hypothetical protein
MYRLACFQFKNGLARKNDRTVEPVDFLTHVLSLTVGLFGYRNMMENCELFHSYEL